METCRELSRTTRRSGQSGVTVSKGRGTIKKHSSGTNSAEKFGSLKN